ncbi:hypothetical protein [Mucilaginibacter gossypii]|uniref:hypothetical protein n=1 Tax=Mucilaginibacter gossypii TaxID=551996 RepID=UPI00115F8B3E|nr:hypothetical protein [Mucilaginibacter gossypii]
MKNTTLIYRVLPDSLYLIFGLNYFLHFITYQSLHAGKAVAFIARPKARDIFYPMQNVIQIVSGLSLIFNRYAPFSTVVLFPVSLNALLFHTFLVRHRAGSWVLHLQYLTCCWVTLP